MMAISGYNENLASQLFVPIINNLVVRFSYGPSEKVRSESFTIAVSRLVDKNMNKALTFCWLSLSLLSPCMSLATLDIFFVTKMDEIGVNSLGLLVVPGCSLEGGACLRLTAMQRQ